MPNFYSTLRRFALTTLLSGGGLLAAQAQTLSQPVSGATTVAGTYTDLGTTGTVIATANTDNANSAAQNIGFSFGFNGAIYTQFVLNTNGVIRLGSAAPSSASLFIDSNGIDPVQSGSAADVNLIIPFNIDLMSGTGTGGAEYRLSTTGTAGSRVCTIQWKNVADKTGTGTGNAAQLSNFSFQVKLYEGVGTIEFIYDTPTASAAAANSRDVNVGLKGSGIGTGQLLLATKTNTTAWSAATFQNTGYGTNTFNIDKTVLPTSGRTYRFLDPTYCVAQSVTAYPYTQNFDGVTAPALPCGITVLDGNGDNNTWATYNSTTYASSTPNSMRYLGNTAIANDWFFTNSLTMTAGNSYQLQFKYRSYTAAYTQNLEVKVGTAATVAGQTTTVYTNAGINNATYNTTNNTQVVLYTPTTTGTYYFGFHAMSSASQLWLLVDDVQVTEVPTPACPQPTNITLSNVAATTATVTFTPPAGGTTYSVVYGPKGFTPPTGGTATPLSASTTVALTGLNSNTPYDVYVQATCGTAGTSVYTGPIAFTTACATVTGFPYNETFDTVTAPALPCGITVLDANADGNTWANNNGGTTYSSSSPNEMRYTYSAANAANDWFFTNGLAMTAGNSYQLQFKYRTYTLATYVQGLEVKVGTAATAAGQTATVFSNTAINNITYNTTNNGQVALFTPTTSGTYYFGFHAISAANQFYLYVDDVQVTQVVTPACINPGNPVVSGVTSTGATVAFTGPSNATGYSVIYGPAGFVPSSTSSATPVAAGTSVTLSGLIANTPYDVYVQTTCGTSGTSVLSGPVSFRTACAPSVTSYPYLENFDSVTAPTLPCGITVIDVNGDTNTWKNTSNATYAASGTNAMTYTWNGTNAANDWFFTNSLQMRVGYSYQLQFKYRGYGSLTEAMEVKVGNASTVAAQTTTVFTNNSFNSSTYTTTTAGSGAGQVLLFTPTTAGTYNFGFHAISPANQWYIYVDDIQVTEVVSPACPQPTALTVSGITTTGATVAFNGPTAGTSYNIIYGPTGFTPPTGGTTSPAGAASPITLSGLTPNTNYDVYVQATCGTAGTSTLTGPISFATACATVTTFPYLETFDGVTAPALPCGITVLNVNNDTGVWANYNATGTTYAASGPNCMRYNYSGANAGNDWFFTPAIMMQAGATYQLQFKYRGYGSLTESMEVKVGNAATVAGQTTTLFTNNSFNSATYTTTTAGTGAGQVAGFTPTTSGIYYFGFHATSPADQWNIYVDDVRVDAVSLAACPTPSNVVLSGVTATNATVSFTGPTTLATGGYTVIYGPPGFDPAVTGTRVTGASSPISLTGLTSLTTYDLYVVASCAASVNSFPSAKLTFTSACATTTTFPYTQNFDGVTAPTLPCGVTTLDANGDGSTWVNSTFNPSSGVNSMRYNPSTINAADDWFFTNALALKANMNYQLQFKYRVFSYNYPEKMEVKIGTSTTAASQTTTLFSNMAIINSVYTTTSPGTLTGQVASFTPPVDGTYFIGFHALSPVNQFDIYVDDLQVTAVANTTTATKSNVAPGFRADASPVPFSDHLTLTLNTLAAGPLQLTLHDAVGRVVRETSATVPAGASSLAVPGAATLPAGMYILTVRQGGNTQVIRVAHE